MSGLQLSLLIHRRPALRSRSGQPFDPGLNVVCFVVVGPVLVCVCAGGCTSAAEDDGASMGPVGKQLWPRAQMPAMMAELKERLSSRQSDRSQTVC